LRKQTIITVAFVSSPQNISVSGLCGKGQTHITKAGVIDIQQLITPLRNNIFQRSFVVTSAIFLGIKCLDLFQIWHFYCTMSRGLFFADTVCDRSSAVYDNVAK